MKRIVLFDMLKKPFLCYYFYFFKRAKFTTTKLQTMSYHHFFLLVNLAPCKKFKYMHETLHSRYRDRIHHPLKPLDMYIAIILDRRIRPLWLIFFFIFSYKIQLPHILYYIVSKSYPWKTDLYKE